VGSLHAAVTKHPGPLGRGSRCVSATLHLLTTVVLGFDRDDLYISTIHRTPMGIHLISRNEEWGLVKTRGEPPSRVKDSIMTLYYVRSNNRQDGEIKTGSRKVIVIGRGINHEGRKLGEGARWVPVRQK